jgi:hypothetical protein
VDAKLIIGKHTSAEDCENEEEGGKKIEVEFVKV